MADIIKSKVIRETTGLGEHDIAMQSTANEVTLLWNAYIKDGVLKIATSRKVDGVPTKWVDQPFPAYLAKDCAIEMNGVWNRQDSGQQNYRFDTDQYPWIFWVSPGNRLLCCRYDNYDDLNQLDEDVVSVCAVRGFGSPFEYTLDQGLIAAYIKVNGFAYYKNYTRQDKDLYAWQGGGNIPLPDPVETLSIFRGNDYRVGFVGTSASNVSLVMCQRSWLGMSIAPEHIEVSVSDITFNVSRLSRHHLDDGDEHVTVSVLPALQMLYASLHNEIINISNADDGSGDWGRLLHFNVAHAMFPEYAVTLMDDDGGTEIATGSMASDDNYNFTVTTDPLVDAGMNNAFGTVTITVSGLNEAGYTYNLFSKTFLPDNLVPLFIPLPEVEVIYNE